jgi:ubiquinone/menaquinone biosynthesis C-methylase UbiE
MNATLEAYERWAPNYPPEPHNPVMVAEQRELLAQLPPLGGLRVLDLACGTGRYARLAADLGAGEVVAADFSPAMLGRVAGALRVRAGLAQLPFRSDTFDCVISGLALGHAPDLGSCFGEIARVLRAGGTLVYSDFHDDAWRAGFTRSFKDSRGDDVTVPRDGYLPAQHRAALLAAGFEVQQMKELRVGIEFTEPFTNSAEFYRSHAGVPLVLIVRARRQT